MYILQHLSDIKIERFPSIYDMQITVYRGIDGCVKKLKSRNNEKQRE